MLYTLVCQTVDERLVDEIARLGAAKVRNGRCGHVLWEGDCYSEARSGGAIVTQSGEFHHGAHITETRILARHAQGAGHAFIVDMVAFPQSSQIRKMQSWRQPGCVLTR